jgi:hypothetical protein
VFKKILLEGDAAVLSDTAPVDVDFGVADKGVATDASRRDHKHDVPEALVGDIVAPSFVGAGVGTANKFIRADHKHQLTEGSLTDLQPVDGTAESLGTADKLVRADHIHALGPLVANLDFAKKQATSLVLDVQATAPSTPVVGQVYHNSVDGHPYVYVT